MGRSVYIDDRGNYTTWVLFSGGFNHAGQVLGERPDELQRLTIKIKLGHWLMSHPRKKISLLKTDTFFKIAQALKCADIMRNGCSKRRGKEVTALFSRRLLQDDELPLSSLI